MKTKFYINGNEIQPPKGHIELNFDLAQGENLNLVSKEAKIIGDWILDGMPTLDLVLTGQWFDMIESGEKPEEYRQTKEFWNKRFASHIKIKGKWYHPSDVLIRFSHGYSTNRRQMIFECKGLRQKEGNPKWGAEKGVVYHVLILGKRVK